MPTKKKKAFISIFAIFFSAIIVSVLIALFALLIKQIQLLSLDSSSFQAFYTADSAAECAVSLEKQAAQEAYQYSLTSSSSKFVWDTTVFRSENWSKFQGCAKMGDVVKDSQPTSNISNKTQAEFKLKFDIDSSTQFCGLVTVIRNLRNLRDSNVISATGRSTSCDDVSNAKVVEREVGVEY